MNPSTVPKPLSQLFPLVPMTTRANFPGLFKTSLLLSPLSPTGMTQPPTSLEKKKKKLPGGNSSSFSLALDPNTLCLALNPQQVSTCLSRSVPSLCKMSRLSPYAPSGILHKSFPLSLMSPFDPLYSNVTSHGKKRKKSP